MIVIDRYIDNSKEIEFELALQELEQEQMELKAQEALMNINISNPHKIIGAQ